MKFLSKLKHSHWQTCIWKCRLPKWRPSCPASIWWIYKTNSNSSFKQMLLDDLAAHALTEMIICSMKRHYGDFTCMLWPPISQAADLFVQQFVRDNNKLTIRYRNFWSSLLVLCEGNPLVTSRFPPQRTSNAESVSMPWNYLDTTQGVDSI